MIFYNTWLTNTFHSNSRFHVMKLNALKDNKKSQFLNRKKSSADIKQRVIFQKLERKRYSFQFRFDLFDSFVKVPFPFFRNYFWHLSFLSFYCWTHRILWVINQLTWNQYENEFKNICDDKRKILNKIKVKSLL